MSIRKILKFPQCAKAETHSSISTKLSNRKFLTYVRLPHIQSGTKRFDETFFLLNDANKYKYLGGETYIIHPPFIMWAWH